MGHAFGPQKESVGCELILVQTANRKANTLEESPVVQLGTGDVRIAQVLTASFDHVTHDF